jgi:hypothetical protein
MAHDWNKKGAEKRLYDRVWLSAHGNPNKPSTDGYINTRLAPKTATVCRWNPYLFDTTDISNLDDR